MNDREFFTFGAISFLIAKLLAFGLMIKALLDIKKLCGRSLLASFLTYTLCLTAAAFLASFGVNVSKSGLDVAVVFGFLAFVLLFVFLIAMASYYSALSYISDEKSFWVVFWLNFLSIFLTGIVVAVNIDNYGDYREMQRNIFIAQTIAIILSLISFFVELYAWSKVKKFKTIENSNSNGDDEASNRDSYF